MAAGEAIGGALAGIAAGLLRDPLIRAMALQRRGTFWAERAQVNQHRAEHAKTEKQRERLERRVVRQLARSEELFRLADRILGQCKDAEK